MLRNKWLGHLMIIFTQVVLGVNIPITRDLLLNYLSPMGYIGVRAVGAALFFWTIQFFAKRERIDKRDFWLILLGGFLGFVFSQYLTSLSLQYTTPVYFSLILALSPVVVLLLQAIFFGEKITRKKLFGILLGILGAAILAVRFWSDVPPLAAGAYGGALCRILDAGQCPGFCSGCGSAVCFSAGLRRGTDSGAEHRAGRTGRWRQFFG